MLAGCVPWPEEVACRYRELGYWEGISLFEMLRRSAARTPDKIALVDGGRRCSYAEMIRESECLAAGLQELGLRPLDRVIFQLGNGLEFMFAFLALLRIGVIPVMALPAHRRVEVSQWVRHAEAVAYFVPGSGDKFDFPAMAREVASDSPTLRWTIVAGEPGEGQIPLDTLRSGGEQALAGKPLALPEPPADEVALMLLSGGTTGMPKLIPRTHNDYVYTARRTSQAAGISSDTVFLAVLPMAHNYTLACPGVLGTLSCGGTLVIAPGTAAEAVFPAIEQERVNVLGATVPLVAKWLNSGLFGQHDLSSLKVFINGGAKLPPELRRRVEQQFHCDYQENFGTGEGLVNTTRPGDPDQVRYHSSGRPISDADEIRVLDENGNDVAPGQIGELVVRGPNTVRGYYNAPEATKAAFTPDGYYRMGDIVRLVDGYIYLEGRRKDLINRGGEKISCEEIEDYILAHPKVASVCVVAMPDDVFGEKACAFVIPRDGRALALPELVAFLNTRGIARFKLPERLEVVGEFPISPAGKVLRRELRERIALKIARERAERQATATQAASRGS
jgi:2,3-dihydroxybenzoate-AMP ligase